MADTYIQPYMHILNWKPSFVIFKIRKSIIRVRRSGKNISRFLNVLMSPIIPNMCLTRTMLLIHDTHVDLFLWGFKTFGFPVCYKHVAPLEALVKSIYLDTINMSPLWGFNTFGFPLCYKHVAPLGLNT